ncbi:DUF692 domain-containing protein [Pseudonocardia xishanensis]|uniref:DUF692 domain-containing protein n=1 Tax=Pseudonocardia xishanensis TaxID=630995 RepID=UPI0031EE7D34
MGVPTASSTGSAERSRAVAGVGIGWRPEIAQVVAGIGGLGFCEVIAEAIAPAAPPRGVAELRARGIAVVPHGVRLGLGDAEGVDPARVAHLAACAEAVGAPLVSEHVAFVRAGGREAGHLLPVPRTREALAVLVENVRRTRDSLGVPLAVEPIAALFDWPEDEFAEGDFLTELLDRTGALLLLDVANVYANARNRSRDPSAVLDRFPLDRVAYVHMAGGAMHDGLYHDTHVDPLPGEVLTLLDEVRERGAAPAVMLERDGHYPPAAALHAELTAIATTAHLPLQTPHLARDTTAFETDIWARESDAQARSSDATACEPSGRPRGSDVTAVASVSRTVASHLPAPVSDTRAAGSDSRAVVSDERAWASDSRGRRATLVSALVDGGPDPVGVDAARLAAVRKALLRKRAGEAAKYWPLLAADLGSGFTALAVEVLAGRSVAGGLQDGWDVARTARLRDLLTDGARRELRDRESAHRYDGIHAPRRRRVRLPRLRSGLTG